MERRERQARTVSASSARRTAVRILGHVPASAHRSSESRVAGFVRAAGAASVAPTAGDLRVRILRERLEQRAPPSMLAGPRARATAASRTSDARPASSASCRQVIDASDASRAAAGASRDADSRDRDRSIRCHRAPRTAGVERARIADGFERAKRRGSRRGRHAAVDRKSREPGSTARAPMTVSRARAASRVTARSDVRSRTSAQDLVLRGGFDDHREKGGGFHDVKRKGPALFCRPSNR